MNAAMRVFIAAGFGGASMEAIAREAGITKRTLYRRAANKRALFVLVVERMAANSGILRLSDIAEGPLEERLHAASKILLGWLLAPDAVAFYRIIVAEAPRHPGLAETVDGPFQQASEAIVGILAQDETRPLQTIRLGADMFVRLVAGEALDRAAQGLEPAGVTDHVRERGAAAVEFFLTAWRVWRV